MLPCFVVVFAFNLILFIDRVSTQESVVLKTACVQDEQCVFKMSGISVGALNQTTLEIITTGIPCKPECSTNSRSCSCCDERVQYLQETLQAYREAYTNFEETIAAIQRQELPLFEYRASGNRFHIQKNALLKVCSQVHCSDTDICEFIKCHPCDPATKTSTSTTTAATNTASPTTTIRTSSESTTASSETTADVNGQSQTIPTTPTSTASHIQITDGPSTSAAQDSTDVAAVVIGVVVSVLAAVGVAVLVIFWWRRRTTRKGGRNVTNANTVPDISKGTNDHGFQDADNYAVVTDVTNHHIYVNSMTTSHQSETFRTLRTTDSLGYENVATTNSQKEYPKNSRPENSDEYYSPLNITDRERSKTDEEQEYTPLEMYQNAQNKT